MKNLEMTWSLPYPHCLKIGSRTHPPSGFGEILLQLLRNGAMDVLRAGRIARYPVGKAD